MVVIVVSAGRAVVTAAHGVNSAAPLLWQRRLRGIIDKFVLRREIGGSDVLRDQLTHLLANRAFVSFV